MSAFVDILKSVAQFAGEVVDSICGWVQKAANEHPQVVGTIIIVLGLALLVKHVLS